MPSADVFFSVVRRVFAHYFYPFPLVLAGPSGASDYYSTQYLTPSGESGKHLANGGYLRVRPLVAPSNILTIQSGMQVEVAMAISRGITGFTFDLMTLSDATSQTGPLQTMLAAAMAVDSRFSVIPMLDMTALGSSFSSDSAAQMIAAVAARPNMYRLPDGRVVFSSFAANVMPVTWWQAVIATLNNEGINVAFIPVLLGEAGDAGSIDAASYGVGAWGTAAVVPAQTLAPLATGAHNNGLKYMIPLNSQQNRPKSNIFYEANNSGTFRASWVSAIGGGANDASDFVQFVTWNDYSETGQIAPFTDLSLSGSMGTAFYDLAGYYSAWFATGVQPPIVRDVLYWIGRKGPSTAPHPNQSTSITVGAGSPAEQSTYEMLAFLTAPGVLAIKINGVETTMSAAAGITSFVIPTVAGVPTLTLRRNGVDVFSGTPPFAMYGSAGLPSGITDMTYWGGSVTKTGVTGYTLP